MPRLKCMVHANTVTTDWLLQAESLANFAQAMKLDERPVRGLVCEVNAMDETSSRKKGHTADECRKKKRDNEAKKKGGSRKKKVNGENKENN
jgi:hypothetical protein